MSLLPPQICVRPRPLARAIRQGLPSKPAGFGLLGIIVTLALSSAVLGVAYTAYEHTQRTNEVNQAAASTRAISQSVLSSYASAASFYGLNTTRAVQDGVIPKSMLDGAQPTSVWGSTVEVVSVSLPGPSGPGSDNGFALTFDNVPQALCTAFTTNAGQGFYDVKINGTSAMTGTRLTATSTSLLCASAPTSTVQFIQAKVSPKGAQLASLTPCVVQPDQYQNVACPAGQISSVAPYGPDGITQRRSSFCNMAYGPVGWSPWAPDSSTCAPICAPPANTTESQNQTTACPAGQVTIASGASSFTQTQTRAITYSCPAPTGGYTTTPGPWGGWTPAISSACAPACVAPPATTQSQNQPAGCPAGQVTSSGASSFTQTQTRSVSYSCPAPTGAYATSYGGWSVWSPAVSSACAPACVAPASSSVSQTQSASCPAGQVTSGGASTFTQSRTATTTYNCPSPQGAYASGTSYTTWSPAAGSVCATACSAPPPTTQTQTLGCPSGQSGSISQKRTVLYNCASPTGSYSTAYGPWSNTSNTCAPTSPPVSICSVDFGSSVGSGQVVYIDSTLHVVVTNVSGWAGATPRGMCSDTVKIYWSGVYQGINGLVQSSSSAENQMATFDTYPDPAYPNGP